MPVTRTARLQGMSWPRPARAPLARRLPGGARLSGAAGGVCLASQGPRRGAPPPTAGACLVHVGPHAIGAQRFTTVSCGTSFAQVAGAVQDKQARVENPERMRPLAAGLAPPGGYSFSAAPFTDLEFQAFSGTDGEGLRYLLARTEEATPAQ
jgi:hypothetical protein